MDRWGDISFSQKNISSIQITSSGPKEFYFIIKYYWHLLIDPYVFSSVQKWLAKICIVIHAKVNFCIAGAGYSKSFE